MERCAVIQAEFAAEVEHREAVGEDEELVRRAFAERGKACVEFFNLRAVVIAIRAVEIFVCGIGLADRVADGAAEDNGVFRRRPDVLVVFDLVAVVLIFFMIVVMVIMVIVAAMLMVVAVRALHALDIFLVERVDVVHHAGDDGDIFARGAQHAVDPVFPLTAVVEENIGFGDRDGVERRGLEAVRLAPRREQKRDVRAVADDGAGEVIIGEKRRDDLKLAVVRLFRRHGAGGEGKCQRERQKKGSNAFHAPS